MRALKEIYPQYSDQVAFIGVDVDPSESAEKISAYASDQGYPWPMAEYDPDILVDYGIRSQASKVMIGGDGVITFRATSSKTRDDKWHEVFQEVIAQSAG